MTYPGISADIRAIRHGFIWGLAAIVMLLAILYGPDLAAASFDWIVK